MIIAITGSPGTGKHTVGKLLAKSLNYKIIDISKEINKKLIDIKEMNDSISNKISDNSIIISHLSHFLNSKKIDLFIVLRCRPDILKRRLKKRGYSEKKIHDNVLFEALDGTYIEAKELHRNVIQIDNSGDVERTVKIIKEIINGKKVKGDKVDYSKYISKIERF